MSHVTSPALQEFSVSMRWCKRDTRDCTITQEGSEMWPASNRPVVLSEQVTVASGAWNHAWNLETCRKHIIPVGEGGGKGTGLGIGGPKALGL